MSIRVRGQRPGEDEMRGLEQDNPARNPHTQQQAISKTTLRLHNKNNPSSFGKIPNKLYNLQNASLLVLRIVSACLSRRVRVDRAEAMRMKSTLTRSGGRALLSVWSALVLW